MSVTEVQTRAGRTSDRVLRVMPYPAAPLPAAVPTDELRLGRYLVALNEGAQLLLGGISPRTWAEGRERSFFEVLAASFGSPSVAVSAFTLRARPVDASVLIEELLAATRRGHTVASMDLFHFQIVRAFVPRSVVAAVDGKLPSAAERASLDVQRALAMWDVMRADLRVVDVRAVDPARYPGLAGRDSSDLEVQALSDLLGVPAWASDPDLIVEAGAERYERSMAYDIGDVTTSEGAAAMSTAVIVGALRGASGACVAIVRALGARPVLGVAVAGAIGIGLALAWRHRAELRARIGPAELWRERLEVVTRSSARAVAWHHALQRQTTWNPELEADQPLSTTLVRCLAVSGAPLSAAQLSALLDRRGIRATEVEVRRALESQPGLFVRSSRGQYQLGHDVIPVRSGSVKEIAAS